MSDEPGDEELERRMRAKLRPAEAKGDGLTEEQRRWARRLVGHSNAERLASAPAGRKVRPMAVIVYFEFYWLPSDEYRRFPSWHMNRVENGRPEDFRHGDDIGELRTLIANLRKKGHNVRELQMGFPRRNADRKQESHRKAILKRLGSFRP